MTSLRMSVPIPCAAGSGNSYDKLALSFASGGVLLAILVAMVGRMLGHDFAMMAYGIFAAFQVAAIVLGIITRESPIGKTAAITSDVLLIGSLLVVA